MTVKNTNAEPPPPDDKDLLFGDFDAYDKILRTWFVAYGIGGPALLLTNDGIRSKITASGWLRWIALAFLLGGALQVLLTIANKAALWGCYRAARESQLVHRPPLPRRKVVCLSFVG